jgi:hypothetical protein
VGGPALWYHGDCLRPTDRSDLCTGQQHTNVYQDLNNSKNIAFNVNKADKRGCRPDATAKGWKSDARGVRAGLADLGNQTPVSNGRQGSSDLYQQLLRQQIVP